MLRTNNRGVAAAFANRRPATNSNGQFFSPDGITLYSYGAHWPVARWHDGQLHVNDGKYSVTTSKHRSFMVGGMVREAPSALDKAIHHASGADLLKACGVEG